MLCRTLSPLPLAILIAIQGAAQKQPSDDALAEELNRVKLAYETAIKQATEKLLRDFDEKKIKMESNTRIDIHAQMRLLDQLKREREDFSKDNSQLPESGVMSVVTREYLAAVTTAKLKCSRAYEKIALAYRKKKMIDRAREVIDDKTRLLASIPPSILIRPGMKWEGTCVWIREGPNTPRIGERQWLTLEILEARKGELKGLYTWRNSPDARPIPVRIRGKFRGPDVSLEGDGDPIESMQATVEGRFLRGKSANWTFELERVDLE